MKEFVQKNLKVISFLILSIALLLYSGLSNSFRKGDGWEYILMSVSYSRHHSFNLQEGDLEYAYKNVALKNNLQDEFNIMYSHENKNGYFESLKHKTYSLHFWGYSLIASLFIPIFSLFKLHLLNIFQFTNSLFLILLMYWINFRAELTYKQRLWLNFITLAGPTWYYLKWTHPEFAVFSLLFISLLEYRDNRKISACLFSALAILQNSVLILFPAFMVIKEIIEKRKINKEITFMSLASAVALLPFAFYYANYNTPSLIAQISSNPNVASVSRALELFFDLNFGLIFFIPLIVITAIWLCIKKDKNCILTMCLIFTMAYICSAQTNWNFDMEYLNRYSYFFIPFLFMCTLDFFTKFDTKTFNKLLILYFITTSIPCLFYKTVKYDLGTFSPLAKIVLSVKPSLYNPDYEIFNERVNHKEIIPQYPIVYESTITGTKKILIKDEKTGIVGYLNDDKIKKITFNSIKDLKIKFRHNGKQCTIKFGEIDCHSSNN